MNREMKNSGIPWIGDIPVSWSVMPHKRVMHKVKEIQEHYNGEDIISLTMRGVIVRDLEAGGKMPTSFDGYQKVYPNNLLQCLFDIDVTPRCVGLIKNEGLTSPAYSQFEMHSNAYAPYYDYLLRYMDDGKTLLHLSKNLRSSLTETDFGAIPTCVPPISVQQKIASFLDIKCAEIDEMIALQEKIVEELKAYKQSVITEAVTKGLNPDVPMKNSGVEWIGEIPEHWKQCRLKNYFHLHGRIGWNGLRSDEFEESSYAYLVTGQDFKAKDIDWKKCYQIRKERYDEDPFIQLTEGDILVTKDGTIGKVAVVKNLNKPACLNSGIFVVKQYEPKCFDSGYVYWLLVSPLLKTFNDFLNLGGTTIIHLYQNVFERMPLVLPPLEEQQAIANHLDKICSEIDSLIRIKESKIDSLKEYKKSIIYEYVTGKKEVTL